MIALQKFSWPQPLLIEDPESAKAREAVAQMDNQNSWHLMGRLAVTAAYYFADAPIFAMVNVFDCETDASDAALGCAALRKELKLRWSIDTRNAVRIYEDEDVARYSEAIAAATDTGLQKMMGATKRAKRYSKSHGELLGMEAADMGIYLIDEEMRKRRLR